MESWLTYREDNEGHNELYFASLMFTQSYCWNTFTTEVIKAWYRRSCSTNRRVFYGINMFWDRIFVFSIFVLLHEIGVNAGYKRRKRHVIHQTPPILSCQCADYQLNSSHEPPASTCQAPG